MQRLVVIVVVRSTGMMWRTALPLNVLPVGGTIRVVRQDSTGTSSAVTTIRYCSKEKE